MHQAQVENALIDRASAERATLVLAHGAGAGMDTPFMTAIASGLAHHGISVLRFEFPYMQKKRSTGKGSPPDRMPTLEAHFRSVVVGLAAHGPLFVGGKSMGGRVAAHVADSVNARGVIALGYPFHPPKQPGKLRLEPLRALQAPCLIVQGTRDPLGDQAEVASYALPSSIALHWLADGDHSFAPRKASGRTLGANLDEAIQSAAAFVTRVLEA